MPSSFFLIRGWKYDKSYQFARVLSGGLSTYTGPGSGRIFPGRAGPIAEGCSVSRPRREDHLWTEIRLGNISRGHSHEKKCFQHVRHVFRPLSYPGGGGEWKGHMDRGESLHPWWFFVRKGVRGTGISLPGGKAAGTHDSTGAEGWRTVAAGYLGYGPGLCRG